MASLFNNDLFMSAVKQSSAGKVFYKYLYHIIDDKIAHFSANNYGYYPVDTDVAAHSDEQYPIQLYRELLKAADPNSRIDSIVEVGCGRGGGISYLHNMLGTAHSTGMDVAPSAISYCQTQYKSTKNLDFVVGDAHELPFADAAYSVVLNVESCHIYKNQARFFKEVARVLQPNGQFLLTDYRPRNNGEMQQLHTDLAAAGLVLEAERDITQNVFQACERDSERRTELIDTAIPRWLRRTFKEYAGLKNTAKFEDFRNEVVHYFIYRLRKK
jgi:ubiquinone/menaquinone biosynthesis C-methylase UbiE